MKQILITNARIINEKEDFEGSLLIKNGLIEEIFYKDHKIPGHIFSDSNQINAKGKLLLPGIIDDQVHFREPGLEHKAEIKTESKAAIAGGITSFMEMPNTKPPAITIEELEKKYKTAAETSYANYSFYFGATNDNINELKKIDPLKVCGVKVFMGSSTGNMLVDDQQALNSIFRESPVIITTHCEDEGTIKNNLNRHINKYGENIPISCHPVIRSEEACYKSSSYAVQLAKKHHSKLHILHLSTEKELDLFDHTLPRKDKKITAEACIHHLWFDDKDYQKFGTRIKWNPAIKTSKDRKALINGIIENKIDIIATDHAPHTIEEKSKNYVNAPSGGPMVQHSLLVMLDFYHNGKLSLNQIADKMCHAPADIFNIKKRGYIKKGFQADVVLVDLQKPHQVAKNNLYYKCGWSPMEGHTFKSSVTHTFVNGILVYESGKFNEIKAAERLEFNR